MPLYLVRWPGLRVSLIRAADEGDLVVQLDERDDPSQCRWTEYDGPLWIDMDVAAEVVSKCPPDREPVSPGEIGIRGAEDLAARVDRAESLLDVRLHPGEVEAASTLQETVLHWAFPHLADVVVDRDGDHPTDPVAVHEALHTEAGSLLDWNRDPEEYAAVVEEQRNLESESGEELEPIVGEFAVDGVEYHAVLEHEVATIIDINRVIEKKPRAGDGVTLVAEKVCSASWDPESRIAAASRETPAGCLALLERAQQALRRELAGNLN